MQPLPLDYLAKIAQQIAFLSAFLGGFAATFLATLLAVSSPKKIAEWTIGCAAFSAVGFIIAVTGSIMMTVVLHPAAPSNVLKSSSVTHARLISFLAFSVGIYTLLCSMGLSGWIRSRRTGMITSIAALMGVVIVTWAFVGFG